MNKVQAREHKEKRRRGGRKSTSHAGGGSYPKTTFIGGPPNPGAIASLPPEIGKELYGQRYDLLNLGVPFDLALPERRDEQARREREYERRTYQRLIAKVKKAATKLGGMLAKLESAWSSHPAEEDRRRQHELVNAYSAALGKAESPLEPSFDARQIARALGCYRLMSECLRNVGTTRARQGELKSSDRSKTEDALAAAGLGSTQIGQVTAFLGMEAPAATDGDLGERVRKRIERKRAKRT